MCFTINKTLGSAELFTVYKDKRKPLGDSTVIRFTLRLLFLCPNKTENGSTQQKWMSSSVLGCCPVDLSHFLRVKLR